jgi:NAD-dependent DNA ligase
MTKMDDIIKKIKSNVKEFIGNISNKELINSLKKISESYYEGNALISDDLYDYLKDELKKRDPKNPFLDEIGAPRMKHKVKLPYFMGSLDKIKASETKEYEKWMEKYKGPYVVSDKLDGISCLLYKQGKKITAYTRGKKGYGQDISFIVPYITNNIKLPDNIAIRGELVITKRNIEKMKKIEKWKKCVDSRSIVAGLTGQKNPDKDTMSYITYITYAIYEPKNMKLDEQYETLKKMGFNIPEFIVIEKLNIKFLNSYLDARRKESKYKIDGIVIFDNSKIYEPEDKTPKHGFAFKNIYDEQMGESIVLNVIWTESMDSLLKPRIEIEPIQILGTTITFITGNNARYIIDNGIGIGSVVKIIKSGDVIPKILEVITKVEPKMPDVSYIWNDTKVDIILEGEETTTVIIKQIEHFFGTLEIKNISSGIITKLVNVGYDDIFKILGADRKKLEEIDGLGKTIITKIYNNIDEKMKHLKLEELMDASHIFGRGMGTKRFKPLIEKYPNLMSKIYTKKELYNIAMSVDGFGEINANKFTENFKSFVKFFDKMDKYYNLDYLKEIKEEKKEDKLSGKIFVMTGFRNKELEEKIEKLGGKISNSVSKNTYIVICKNKNESSSKLDKAKKLGIKIIELKDFEKN